MTGNGSERGHTPVSPTPSHAGIPCGTPSRFALFVKDNYKDVRTPGVSHKDAMKELSKKFASGVSLDDKEN